MNKKKFTKLLALYLPYLVIGLAATNLGEAWRLAEGKELGDKIMSLMGTIPVAFANPLPSLHIHRFSWKRQHHGTAQAFWIRFPIYRSRCYGTYVRKHSRPEK